jgi:membrane protease YdiL (CAAX protease family)
MRLQNFIFAKILKSTIMEDMFKSKKGVPVWVQISFLLLWVGGIASLSALGAGDSSADASLSSLMTPSIIRLLIVFQAILVFFLPIVFFIFLLRQSGLSFLTLGKKPTLRWILFGVLAMLACFPLVSWTGEINSLIKLPIAFSGLENWMKSMENQSSNTSEILLNDKSVLGLILNLLTIAFTAAFSEELFFRALLQQTLTKTKLNYHIGIWIAAFVFSAIHMQFYGFFPRLLLGAVLGYLFYYTGSIWVSIIAHFLNNAFVVVLGFFSGDNVNLNPLEKSKDELDVSFGWPLALMSFVLIFCLFFIMNKNFKKEQSDEMASQV